MKEILEKYLIGLNGYTFRSDDKKYILNCFDEVEKEIERLNNIIEKIDQHLIDSGVDDEILECCDIYDVNGVELRKYIEELKEGK